MLFNATSRMFRGAIRQGYAQEATKDFIRGAGYVGERMGMGRGLAGIYAGQQAGRFAKNAGAYAIKNLGVANYYVQGAWSAAKKFDYMGAASLGAGVAGSLGKSAWRGAGGPKAWSAGKKAWSTTGGKIGIGAGAAVIAGGAGYAMSRGRGRDRRGTGIRNPERKTYPLAKY